MEKDKRQRIIDAAIGVFCTAGYDGASMAEVSESAGVGKGTLYLYFDSKAALFEEAYRQCHEARVAACRVNMEQVQGAIDKLCVRLRNGTRWEMKSPLHNKLERVYLADPRFGGNVRSKVLGMRVDAAEEIIRAGVASGELRDMPVQLMEEMYYRLGSAVYYYIADHPDDAENEALWDKICASLRGCLGA